MQFEFTNPVFEWRGPAPYFYVALSHEVSQELTDLAPVLTFGWGMIPGAVTVGETDFTTALFRKDGLYLIPLRKAIREAEGIELGDTVSGTLVVGV